MRLKSLCARRYAGFSRGSFRLRRDDSETTSQ